MAEDETTTIQVYKSDLSGRRLGRYSEPDDRGRKDELRRALDLLDAAESAGLLDGLDVEEPTPAQERAEKAESDEGQLPLDETPPGQERAQGAPESDESEAEAFGSVEELVGDVETIEEARDDEADVEKEAGGPVFTADLLADWRPGRDAEERERKREIGAAALEWLQTEDGGRSASDFKAALYDEHHVDGQGRDAWWRRTVRPALQEAEEAGYAEYHHGRHEYVWTGPFAVQK